MYRTEYGGHVIFVVSPVTPSNRKCDHFILKHGFTVLTHQSPFFFLGAFPLLAWFWKEKRRFILFLGRSSSRENDVTWNGKDGSCQIGIVPSEVHLFLARPMRPGFGFYFITWIFHHICAHQNCSSFTPGRSTSSLGSVSEGSDILSWTFHELFRFITACHLFHVMIPK